MKKPLIVVLTLAGVSLLAAAILTYSRRPVTHAPELPPPGETNNAAVLTETPVPPTAIIEGDGVAYVPEAKGFYARPAADGEYPGVVMIHEWWGLNDNIKTMARELARQGYQVLAVDLYRGEAATTPERARQLTSSVVKEEAVANLRQAASYLRGRGAAKLASLGWCFGGGQSLNLALSGESLDATIIYYGSLVTDAGRLKAIAWPVLGIFGEKDASIPVATVEKFGEALTTAGVANSIHVYPGVGHAFANPSGANYAPEPTADAWQKTLDFLDLNLR